jgi:hypothetical protein
MVARLAWLAFVAIVASVVGVATGLLLLSFVLPGPAEGIAMYGAAALVIAVPASLLLGLPTVLLARSGRVHRLIPLLNGAVFAALVSTFLGNCWLLGCLESLPLSYPFSIVCAVATAVLLHVLLPRENAL